MLGTHFTGAMARRGLALLGLWCLAAGGVGAAGFRIQSYQGIDEGLIEAVGRSLGSDRTLRFRYEQDFPDDHVFPNGVRMQQMHAWLTKLIEAWNREPLMPMRLSLERGDPDLDNVIKFDETGKETGTSSGLGGWGYQWIDSQHVAFGSHAILNVSQGSLKTREEVEATAKHEMGHCLTLLHSPNRASAMAYLSAQPPWDGTTGFFSLDDLLSLRAVWARLAPGFGAVTGHLVYADGSPVGGEVAALDDGTGEVLMTWLSDPKHGGRFRLELPAGRRVRLIAYPVQGDLAIFGHDFLHSDQVTASGFEPTELLLGDRSAAILVPSGAARDLDPFVVTPAAGTPLVNRDALTRPLLPGEKAHIALRFKGLGSEAPQVQATLSGLAVEHVARVSDRVEFDVAASPGAAGVSGLEVQSGAAACFQAGTLWVRPAADVVRVTHVEPLILAKGQKTELLVQGMGLDRVTDVRVAKEGGSATLAATLTGRTPEGGLKVQVEAPDGAARGPWRLQVLVPGGEALRAPEPLPWLWAGPAGLVTEEVSDPGEVTVNQPASFSIRLRNVASQSIRVTAFSGTSLLGQIKDWQITDSPLIPPGGTGRLRMRLTPTRLGPLVFTVQSTVGSRLEAVSELRLWAVP
jgi:hypothetical protein